MQRRTFLTATAAASLAGTAWAQASDGTLRWIVPYPAGGGTDVLARSVADALHTGTGQTVVVDNRPGASTNIAADLVAHAKPDGLTVMSADNALLAFNEHLFGKLNFNPAKDFTYIAGMARMTLALVVHPGFEAQTAQDFLRVVRAKPDQINYASPGNGSPHHLAMELFKSRTGTRITHVPYKGAAPAMQDLMGGQVQCMFLDLAAGLPVIASGKVRALALAAPNRAPGLPNVPTLREVGVSDAEVYAIQGVVGPAGMAPGLVAKLNGQLNNALASPAVKARMADFGMEPLAGTPDAFYQLARAESARWGQVIKQLNIKLD
jgi:tripartite-type tricarboxylate transporter receptor subunit TctC